MASCAPPEREQNELNELNELLGHDAATQTELTMDAIAKLETVEERRLKHCEQSRKNYAAKKRKLEQLMIRNANLEQAAREVAASAAALAAPTPPLPPLPLPAPLCPTESQLFGSDSE